MELLVVTGLLAGFFSLLITGLRPTGESEVRQAARQLQSAIMQAQTRALSQGRGTCLIFTPTMSGTACTAVAVGEPRQIIQTFTTATEEELQLLFTNDKANLGFSFPSNADITSLEAGYRVRFSAGSPSLYGPWYEFSFIQYDGSGTLRALVEKQSGVIDPGGDVLPAQSVYPVACQVSRHPIPQQSSFMFPKRAAIDLRYSGLGDDPSPASASLLSDAPLAFKYASLCSGTAGIQGATGLDTISLEFDRTGTITSVLRSPLTAKDRTPPIDATTTIYLLVALATDIAADAALASAASLWVAVTPATGKVLVGKNNPTPLPNVAGLGKVETQAAYSQWYRQLRASVR